MARELSDFARILRVVEDSGQRRIRVGLEDVAQQIERKAKDNANTGSHPKGERHVAGTGPGPNVVSGNLRRSITHTSVRRDTTGWFTRVGVAMTAPYGKWLEKGPQGGSVRRRGTGGRFERTKFPFLLPAAREQAKAAGTQLRNVRDKWT